MSGLKLEKKDAKDYSSRASPPELPAGQRHIAFLDYPMAAGQQNIIWTDHSAYPAFVAESGWADSLVSEPHSKTPFRLVRIRHEGCYRQGV